MVSKTGAKAAAAKGQKVYAPVKRVGPYPKFARKVAAKNARKAKNREARQAQVTTI